MNEREYFLQEIERILIEHQFSKTNDGFICIQQQQQPGPTININGQIMQQPPIMIENKFVVTLLGEGWVCDINDDNKQFFEQIRFEIIQNNIPIFIIEDCFYYHDYNNIMKNFLQQ